jgi:hypothetical protein
VRFDTKVAITVFVLVLLAMAIASWFGWVNWSEAPP